ncbi:MAG: ABC transporter permease, partial [Ferruginibacter sp.]
MKKILQILQREYLNRVMRPAFLITTLLVPIVIAGFYAAIAAIATDSSNSQTKIAVMDPANRLNGQLNQLGSGLEITYIESTNESDFVKRYDSLGYELFLFIPPAIFDDARQPAILHTQKTPAFASFKSIQTILNNQYREHTFESLGIDTTKRRLLSLEIPIITMTDKEAGSKKTNADIAYGLSYVCGFLIYILMLTYGTQVMRGVSEEKVNRI